jgi:hypothetical protein
VDSRAGSTFKRRRLAFFEDEDMIRNSGRLMSRAMFTNRHDRAHRAFVGKFRMTVSFLLFGEESVLFF